MMKPKNGNIVRIKLDEIDKGGSLLKRHEQIGMIIGNRLGRYFLIHFGDEKIEFRRREFDVL